MTSMGLLVALLICLFSVSVFGNKYSKEANKNVYLERNQFRMAKLNLLWDKALKRLAEPKLNLLQSELKMQDKEEMTLKKLKTDGGDKEGLKEAELRKKLRGIMVRYNLSDDLRDNRTPASKEAYLNEVTDQKILKAIFKDKKLNRLWEKAESSGFTEPELKALKEEFQHHQDKVDDYYSLINTASVKLEQDQNHLENDIKRFDSLQDMVLTEKPGQGSTNTIREKHRELKEGYDRLHKISTTGPDSKDFVEPKVAGLWKLAVRGDFTQEELESLHTELKHYEHRLLKVRHMTGQMSVLQERAGDDIEKLQSTEGQRIMQERLTKQQRKVEKLHEDLEMRILQRHLEL
ncbi:alpha-2-macroglobulin receptor-associated protein-like [Homarus americanus]|uniref:Alpha-2-macroglobulin receptor-associated protein-like n=1 Tax=Homarus americanus TaxID=6706 RepID=A0A8J5N6F1_HOMAM|nr:alpha-2-macroglobulin receptor-associated protein-like [Homarus americanus]KAG7174057.1 Alpha-2-macroglobulin receptor-associated protein-like [Homarus americanus]